MPPFRMEMPSLGAWQCANGKKVFVNMPTRAGNKPNIVGAPKTNIQHNSQHTEGLCFLRPIRGTLMAAKASREPQALTNTACAHDYGRHTATLI